MTSSGELHAMRISQRAAEEARKDQNGASTTPRSRLESFRAEQNLRQQGFSAEAAAEANRNRLATFQARFPPTAQSGSGMSLGGQQPVPFHPEGPSVPSLALNGIAGANQGEASPLTGKVSSCILYCRCMSVVNMLCPRLLLAMRHALIHVNGCYSGGRADVMIVLHFSLFKKTKAHKPAIPVSMPAPPHH